MKKLIDLPEDSLFYRGTIIVIKDAEITPKGNFDKKYCMVQSSFCGTGFDMLDVYHSIGSCVWLHLEPNVKGHYAVNKQGIFDWVKLYFKTFYVPEWHQQWFDKIHEITYVEDLSDYFTQANRDLFMTDTINP